MAFEDDTIIKIALIAGPAGPFTFLITNSTFAGGGFGCGGICAAQHCGLLGAGDLAATDSFVEKGSEFTWRPFEFTERQLLEAFLTRKKGFLEHFRAM